VSCRFLFKEPNVKSRTIRRGDAVWLIVLLAQCACYAQERRNELPATNPAIEQFQFDLSNYEDVKRIHAIRNQLVTQATRILEGLKRGEYAPDDDVPRHAVEALRLLRTGDKRALAALCDNITLSSMVAGDPAPLDGLLAAEALVQIGDPARTAVFDSMRQALDRQNLLVRAHVLAGMDSPAIMRQHLNAAIEEQERREKTGGVPVNENFKGQLRLIESWLLDPAFLRAKANWP
jgi:hypothetical protein